MPASGRKNSHPRPEVTPAGYPQDLHHAVLRYQRPLVAYARTILGDLDLARETAQDTLLKLCEQPEQAFREQIEPRLAAWLFTVCRNRAIDILRKERRMTSYDPHTQVVEAASEGARAGGASALAEQQEEHDALLALVAALPSNQREVVQLRFQGELTYRQISEVTGQSVSNVGVLLHQAMGSLRKQMNQLTA